MNRTGQGTTVSNWCACLQIPHRGVIAYNILGSVGAHIHAHTQRDMPPNSPHLGREGPGSLSFPQCPMGPYAHLSPTAALGSPCWQSPNIPSFLLGYAVPPQGQGGLSCPFPMPGFPFWAVMDCGIKRSLLWGLDFYAPKFPISCMWQGSLIKASLPTMSSSFPSSGVWDIMVQIWEEIIAMGRQTPRLGTTTPLWVLFATLGDLGP